MGLRMMKCRWLMLSEIQCPVCRIWCPFQSVHMNFRREDKKWSYIERLVITCAEPQEQSTNGQRPSRSWAMTRWRGECLGWVISNSTTVSSYRVLSFFLSPYNSVYTYYWLNCPSWKEPNLNLMNVFSYRRAAVAIWSAIRESGIWLALLTKSYGDQVRLSERQIGKSWQATSLLELCSNST